MAASRLLLTGMFSQNSSPKPPAGWFDDPNDPLKLQWWDGAQWSGVRKDKAFSHPAGEQLRSRNVVSTFRVAAEHVSDKVVGSFANRVADVTGDVANKAGNQANGAGDVAGDVADGVAEGAGFVFRLLKRFVMVVLFPLWLVLMLFGCGPLS